MNDVATHLFRDTFVCREGRYTVGIDDSTGTYFFSTPVSGSNRAVEWEAYYRISATEYESFRIDTKAGALFAEECFMGRLEDRLFTA